MLRWEQKGIINGGITLESSGLDLPLYIQWQVSSCVQYILAYTIFFIATFSYALGAVYIWLPGMQTRAGFYLQN